MITPFLNPCQPVVFKRLFGTEGNKALLIHFLNAIFGRKSNPIEAVTFLETAQGPENEPLEANKVKVMCEDTYQTRCIVVLQLSDEPGFEKQAQYDAAKTYIDQCQTGGEHRDVKGVSFLGITGQLFTKTVGCLSHHAMINLQTQERELQSLSFSFLELTKFRKKKEQLSTVADKWAYIFKHAEETFPEEVPMIAGTDTMIESVYQALDSTKWSKEALEAYDSLDRKRSADRAILEGVRVKSLEEGLQKGRETERKVIAKHLYTKGVNVAIIEKATRLSQEILEPLLK